MLRFPASAVSNNSTAVPNGQAANYQRNKKPERTKHCLFENPLVVKKTLKLFQFLRQLFRMKRYVITLST